MVLYAFLFLLLASSSALAQSLCDSVPAPLTALKPKISIILDPLKQAYLDMSQFNLSPIGADIAKMEQVVDPPSKQWTTTFSVRGDSFHQTAKETFSSENIFDDIDNRIGWEGGRFIVSSASISNQPHTFQVQGQTFTLSAVVNTARAISPEDAKNMSFDDKVKLFQSLTKYSSVFGTLAPYDLSTARLAASYLQITAQTDTAGVESALHDLSTKLTTSEKIRLVQLTGKETKLRYDKIRADQNQAGAIPYEDVLYNLKSWQDSKLGVCRDIAPVQSQMLHQLGFKQVYITGYNASGNHATVIAQNPDNPKEMLQFNYEDLQISKLSSGNNSIVKGGLDFSTEQQFFDYKGKSVAKLPTPLAALLQEGGGGSLKTIDPFLRPSGSIVQVALNSPGSSTTIPVFVGQTTSGDQVVGVGLTNHLGNPDQNVLSVKSTTTLAIDQRNSAVPHSAEMIKAQAILLSSNIDATLSTKWQNLNKNQTDGKLQGRLTETTQVRLNGASSRVLTEGYDHSTAQGGSLGVSAEVAGETRYASEDGKTKLNGKAALQYAIGTTDVSGDQANLIYRNLAYVDVNGETVILPSGLKASFDAAVGLRVFGPQIMGSVGVSDASESWKAQAGYQGAIAQNAFTVAPGMEKQYFVELEKKFPKSLIMTVYYEQPVGEPLSQGRVQVGAKGSVSELLKKKK